MAPFSRPHLARGLDSDKFLCCLEGDIREFFRKGNLHRKGVAHATELPQSWAEVCGRLRGPHAIDARNILSGSIAGGDLPRASATATN